MVRSHDRDRDPDTEDGGGRLEGGGSAMRSRARPTPILLMAAGRQRGPARRTAGGPDRAPTRLGSPSARMALHELVGGWEVGAADVATRATRIIDLLSAASPWDRADLVDQLSRHAKRLASRTRADLYQLSEQDFRGRFLTPDADRGWASLLAAAGREYWRSRDTARASRTLEDAWARAEGLPPGVRSARVVATVAVLHASVSATAQRPPTPDGEQAQRHLDRLELAADRIDECRSRPDDLVGLHIRIALNTAQQLERRRHLPGGGWLTTARAVHRVFVRELSWLAGTAEGTCDGTVGDAVDACLDRLCDETRGSFSRLLLQLMNAAHLLGDRDTVAVCARVARDIAPPGRQQLELLFNIAKSTSDLRLQMETLEDLTRQIHAGALDMEPRSLRRGITKRFSDLVRDVSLQLWRNHGGSVAFFWRWEAARVADRLDCGTAAPGPGTPTDHDEATTSGGTGFLDGTPTVGSADLERPHPGPPEGSAQRMSSALGNLRMALENENPVAAAASLRSLACVDEATWPLLEEVSEQILPSVQEWCGQICRREIDPVIAILPSVVQSRPVTRRAAFRVECLVMADRLAAQFLPEMRAQILANLAATDALPVTHRVELATASALAARVSGRWVQELRALRSVIELLHESGDAAAVPASAEALCAAFLTQVGSAKSGVELFELVAASSKVLQSAAVWLARSGHPGQATVVTQVADGWMGRAMAHDPALIADYEALMEALASKDAGGRDALFTHMERRLIAEPAWSSVPVEDGWREVGGAKGAAVVQFLETAPGERLVALVTTGGDDGDQTHRAVELPLTREDAIALAERIWKELRPSRGEVRAGRAPRAADGLKDLHDEVIAPMELVTPGVREVVFVARGALAAFPLHAAHGPDGYLVEHVGVRYHSSLWARAGSPQPDGIADHAVTVGGWDPDIGAPQEARDVAALLRDRGFVADEARNAKAGRQALLSSDHRRAIVHVAAHGLLEAWPAASHSRLQLSRSVEVTAHEWMRSGCRPEFAFLNACGLGRAIPRGGDLNGFPLALHVRGARASVTALGDIPPAAAHRFAIDFYRALSRTDTYEAYLQAVRRAISEGRHVSAWVPYVYSGDPVLAAPAPRPPQQLPARSRRNCGRAASRAGRRRST
jgi:hypothetical protein